MATSLTSITSNTGRDKLIALLEQTLASTARLSKDPADWQPKTDAWEHPLVPANGASDGSISHSPGKVGVFNTNGRPYYNLSEGEGMITFMLPIPDEGQLGWDGPSYVCHCRAVCTTVLAALRSLDARMEGERLVFGYDIEPWKVALALLAESNAEGVAAADLSIHLATPWSLPRVRDRDNNSLTIAEVDLTDYTSRAPASCEIELRSAGAFHQFYIGNIVADLDADMQWTSSPIARLRAISDAIAAGAIVKPAA